MSAFQTYVSQNELLSNAERAASALINQKHSSEFTYHNLAHTLSVTENAFNLGIAEQLQKEDLEDLIIAAFFHDTGYYDSVNEHETIGAKYAKAFLEENNIKAERVERIEKLIHSTKVTTPPSTSLQEVLCDADLNYLGANEFFSLVERLRLEWQLTGRKNFTEEAWIQQNIDFFDQHTFYTTAAQHLFGHVKEANLEQMRTDLRALSNSSDL